MCTPPQPIKQKSGPTLFSNPWTVMISSVITDSVDVLCRNIYGGLKNKISNLNSFGENTHENT